VISRTGYLSHRRLFLYKESGRVDKQIRRQAFAANDMTEREARLDLKSRTSRAKAPARSRSRSCSSGGGELTTTVHFFLVACARRGRDKSTSKTSTHCQKVHVPRHTKCSPRDLAFSSMVRARLGEIGESYGVQLVLPIQTNAGLDWRAIHGQHRHAVFVNSVRGLAHGIGLDWRFGKVAIGWGVWAGCFQSQKEKDARRSMLLG